MHRTQIMLTEAQHARLRDEAARTGASIAALIRRAVSERYEERPTADRVAQLDEAFGAWSDREETGAEYVERIRTGTRARLSREQ